MREGKLDCNMWSARLVVLDFVRADGESCHTVRYMYDNTAFE